MSDVVNRYHDTIDEFAALIDYGTALLEAQANHIVPDDRMLYAERIFAKLICHGISLKRLSPTLNPTGAPELWDVSSCYAIARTLIETYEALAYIALESIDESERSFRIALWKLHSEERRQEMLRLVGSTHVDALNVAAQVTSLRSELLAHPFLATLGPDLARKVTRGETPPYHLSKAIRDERSGINPNYHKVVTMHLSSHVHTHPFSVHQLFEFQAGNDECLQLISVSVQYAIAFLAKSITGMIDLFKPRIPPPRPELIQALDRWNGVLRTGGRIGG